MAISSNLREKFPKMSETLPRLKETLPKLREAMPKAPPVVSPPAPFKNNRIWKGMESRIHYYADHPEEIDARLKALDREWDIHRVLGAFTASAILGGVGLSTRNKRFLAIPGLVSLTLLQHALRGWSLPVPILRRLGVRTRSEIQAERNSLKALQEAFIDLESRLETVAEKAAKKKPEEITAR